MDFDPRDYNDARDPRDTGDWDERAHDEDALSLGRWRSSSPIEGHHDRRGITMTSFRKLPGLPPYGPRAVSFPTEWESRSQEGLVVEFALPSGEKWVGNFKPGGGGVDGVRLHPNGAEVLVMAAGSVWSVDPFGRNAIELAVAVEGTWPVNDPEGLIFSLQGLAFLRLGPSGILWRHARSLGTFRHIELSEHALRESWSAIDDSGSPAPISHGCGYGRAYPESAHQRSLRLARTLRRLRFMR